MIYFITGEEYKFTIKNFEKILQKDTELYKEYQTSYHTIQNKLYLFMGKYNDKHPVYFKIN